MKYLLAGAIATLSLGLMLGENNAGEKKAKYTIPEVMVRAHAKDKLMQKVAAGKASDAEKEELVERYVALSLNEPPKGDAKAWKTRTGALVEAAKKAAKGDEAAAKSLTKLANCKECHSMHK